MCHAIHLVYNFQLTRQKNNSLSLKVMVYSNQVSENENGILDIAKLCSRAQSDLKGIISDA